MTVSNKVAQSILGLLFFSTAYSSDMFLDRSGKQTNACNKTAVLIENQTGHAVPFRLMTRESSDANRYRVSGHNNIKERKYQLLGRYEQQFVWSTRESIPVNERVCIDIYRNQTIVSGYQRVIFGKVREHILSARAAHASIDVSASGNLTADKKSYYHSDGLLKEIGITHVSSRHIQLKPRADVFECDKGVTVENLTGKDIMLRFRNNGASDADKYPHGGYSNIGSRKYWSEGSYRNGRELLLNQRKEMRPNEKVCLDISRTHAEVTGYNRVIVKPDIGGGVGSQISINVSQTGNVTVDRKSFTASSGYKVNIKPEIASNRHVKFIKK